MVGPEPVAMVPVVQLYARDVPELPFPAGTDVLQVVWCPLIHDDEVGAALPKVYWRSEQTVAAGGMLPDPCGAIRIRRGICAPALHGDANASGGVPE